MNILYVSPRRCWPVDSGGRLRDYHLAKQLSRHAKVTYATVCYPEPNPTSDSSSPRVSPGNDAGMGLPSPESFLERHIILPEARRYSLRNLIRGIVGSKPVTLLNWESGCAAEALAALGGQVTFDSIQVEGVHMLTYLPVLRQFRGNPPIVCDWHDILSEQMARYSDTEGNLAKRAYARRTARLLERVETEMFHSSDSHTVVSDRDRAKIAASCGGAASASPSIHVIENGVDTGYFSDCQMDAAHAHWRRSSVESVPVVRNRVLFVGAMDYHANVDAVVRFAKEAWPDLYHKFPELRFTVAGKSPSPAVVALGSANAGIEVTGTVPDVRPYYREARAVVVPLRMGSGTRLKILEAMAAGVPVVSTSLGAEGLDVSARANILIADTSMEMAKSVASLRKDPQLCASLSTAARELVRQRYDWSLVGDRLFEIHRSLVPRSALSA